MPDADELHHLFAAEAAGLDLVQVMIRNLDGSIRFWTRGMERLYGYSAEEARGRISFELLQTEFSRPLGEINEELLKTGSWTGELRHRHRDSRTLLVTARWALGRSDVGLTPIITEVSHDVTELRRVQESQRLLAHAVESSQDGIILRSPDGVILATNRAADTMFGYEPSELIGMAIEVLFPPDFIWEERRIRERLALGAKIAHFETTRKTKRGALLQVSLSISPIYDARGEIIGVTTIIRDLTDRNAARRHIQDLQSTLAHMARISTMSHMASAFAHELNQPLSALASYLSGLNRLSTQDRLDREQLASGIAKAKDQVVRTGEIIGRLRQSITKGEAEKQLGDINEIVLESVELGSIDAARLHVSIDMKLDKAIPKILIDRIQIGQVIVNLVRNAIEAMETSDIRRLHISTELLDNEVEIAIDDTGEGIPQQVLPTLFQPFISSKPSGMGIGLAICREIVEAHDGRIRADSNAPRGTTFRVCLPLPSTRPGI